MDDVERVAKKYISPDKIAVVVVGDAEEILPQIKSYAREIQVVDTNGKSLNIADYNKAATGGATTAANVAGVWNLTIEVQGQKLPVTLTLKQDAGTVSGTLDSMLGKGDFSNGKVSGNRFTAAAKVQAQGQNIELNVSGTIDGDSMKGTINTGIPSLPPLPFEGKRAEAAKTVN